MNEQKNNIPVKDGKNAPHSAMNTRPSATNESTKQTQEKHAQKPTSAPTATPTK